MSLRDENRNLRARLTVLEALVATSIPADVVEEWQTLLADVLWWFRGFEANATKRQLASLPDLGRLRDMRTDIFRVAEGKDALCTIRQEIPF
ncbi:MAG: hypothetical protein JWQ97_3380 [Phenylobacterium sp.]|nr:hypothetical protein [Phenylobacterium sp.]